MANPHLTAEGEPYIGSSDAPMVADLSPWGSPLTVWNRLTGLVPYRDAPTLRMWVGEKMEGILAELYEQKTGRLPVRIVTMEDPPLISKDYPFLGSHPDFDHLEVKTTANREGWGEDGEVVTPVNMAIPLHYFIQVQHNLHVTGWDSQDVAVLVKHDDFLVYTVPRDDQVIGRLVEAEVELWDQAQKGIVPAKSDPESRKAYLRAKFPRETRMERSATPEEQEAVEAWREAKREAAAAEKEADRLADIVKGLIGDNAGFTGLATWKAQTRQSLDSEVIRRELRALGLHDVLEQATKVSEFRVLREATAHLG